LNNRAKDGIKTDKKEIITFTVYKLVAENGLGNIPVSLISKESGVAVGTIYFYFGSKQGLMDSIYSDIMTEISRYIALGIESAKTVEEKIYCFWMGYYSYCINNPLQANFICQPGIEKYISPEVIDSHSGIFNRMESIVEEGIKSGIIADLPYNVILSYLLGPVKYIQNYFQSGQLDIDEEMSNRIFGVFWNGIKNQNGE
jgi:AcrR family transcriptional regulator